MTSSRCAEDGAGIEGLQLVFSVCGDGPYDPGINDLFGATTTLAD